MSMCASVGCALDDRGVVNLDKILQSFGAPISEEQVWALCYAFTECYSKIAVNSKVFLVNWPKHVVLQKDGFIHEETFLPTGENAKGRTRATSEGKIVSELGLVLYCSLDYSLSNSEEREISSSLHRLIDLMTSSEPERVDTDDEGIEPDSEDESSHNGNGVFTMRDAMKTCQDRLNFEGTSTTVVAEEHYRAVVRALVAEALDLTSFLKKVREGTKFVGEKTQLYSSEKDLHSLQCEDWARLWKQVMRQLRDGVNLKKREYAKTPLEYALTPFEMLMEDIRSRRFTLNKVIIGGEMNNLVKKDAHSIILDFIRSRPPLRKASDRKLNPLRKVSSPMELLLESIQTNDAKRLRHVEKPKRRRPMSMIETGNSAHLSIASPVTSIDYETGTSSTIKEIPQKKLIGFARFNPDGEEEDDLSDISPPSPVLQHHPVLSTSTHTHASLQASPTSSNGTSSPEISLNNNGKSDTRSTLSRTAYDLATYGTSSSNGRRHSITICETPMESSGVSVSLERQGSANSSCSNHSNGSSSPSTTSLGHQYIYPTSKTQRDFLSSHFSSDLDCLSLTLEELVHIRGVLTKADLEALPVDMSIKEDMAKGKICFLCMKTRFGFFNSRGRECKLCRRSVCKKCITKMRIPTEHFSNIPVVMLTPHAISPPREDDDEPSLPRSFLNMLQDIPRPGSSAERRRSVSGSVGSAPSSPTTPRSKGGPSSLPSPPTPAPCVTSDIKKKQELRQRQHEMEVRLRGELMCVCLDCKAMVIHVLYSIKLRKNGASNIVPGLSNGISPVPGCSNGVSHNSQVGNHPGRSLQECNGVKTNGEVEQGGSCNNVNESSSSSRSRLRLKLTPVYN